MKYNLFPTPLWYIEGTPQQLIDELYEGAYRFKEKYPSENRSGEGGYQTPSFDWKSFHPQGKEYIEWVIKEHSKQKLWNYDSKQYLRVDTWWFNINPKGAWNVPHNHPGCALALVLYLTDSDGLLTFMSPHNMRTIDNKNIGGIGDIASINAKKGDIVMFPADLNHYVKPNQKEEDRISISMNLNIHI